MASAVSAMSPATTPNTTFAIEYKLKEPRTRLLWSTATATLVNIEDTGVDNLGVVIDFGHSLFAKENPAEALHLLHARGRLVDIELDDNYREWTTTSPPAPCTSSRP